MDIKKIRWLARILFYGPWFIVLMWYWLSQHVWQT